MKTRRPTRFGRSDGRLPVSGTCSSYETFRCHRLRHDVTDFSEVAHHGQPDSGFLLLFPIIHRVVSEITDPTTIVSRGDADLLRHYSNPSPEFLLLMKELDLTRKNKQ
jgi:hypothetical protein